MVISQVLHEKARRAEGRPSKVAYRDDRTQYPAVVPERSGLLNSTVYDMGTSRTFPSTAGRQVIVV